MDIVLSFFLFTITSLTFFFLGRLSVGKRDEKPVLDRLRVLRDQLKTKYEPELVNKSGLVKRPSAAELKRRGTIDEQEEKAMIKSLDEVLDED